MKTLKINDININNDLPFVLIAGVNVLESEDLALEVAETLQNICKKLNIPYIFKASFDKANRSSITSFRGLDFDKSMEIFAKIKAKYNLPILTDVHEPHQAELVAKYVDILQLPAFLSRQTDLVMAMAKTGKIINIKKAQFLAPQEMKHIITKIEECNNHNISLCERGTSFGYNNLVVDMLSFSIMKKFEYPVIFDVTHSLQEPGKLANSAGGRREYVLQLAKAGISQKIAGLFLETHPNPDVAKCDGPSAIHLKYVENFLYQLKEIDEVVKKQNDIYE